MPYIWIKTLQEQNFFGPLKAGQSYQLEEPAWRDDDGTPQFTLAGRPKGRPSWDEGDRVILYIGGHDHTAGLLEVAGPAYESGREDWPWWTNATALVVGGPTLNELGVPHEMVQRRIRWRLDDSQADAAGRYFGIQDTLGGRHQR